MSFNILVSQMIKSISLPCSFIKLKLFSGERRIVCEKKTPLKAGDNKH